MIVSLIIESEMLGRDGKMEAGRGIGLEFRYHRYLNLLLRLDPALEVNNAL